MTHHDLTLLTIGFLLGVAGCGIVAFVRSAAYDRWAEGKAVEAEHIITSPPALGASEWERISRTLAQRDADFAAHPVDAMDRLSSVAPVVPLQRDRRGGASS